MSELMNTRMFQYKNGICTGLASRMDMVMLAPNLTVFQKPFRDCRTVFIHTRTKEQLIAEFIDSVLPKLVHPVVVVIAGEDYTFPNNTDHRMKSAIDAARLHQFQTLGEHPNIRRIFVENLDAHMHHTEPIPLGINPKECSTDLAYFSPFMRIDATKPLRFTNFNRARTGNAQWAERAEVLSFCRLHWRPFVVPAMMGTTHADYLAELGKYAFTVCVHGGGLDVNPKLWEALLVGVIPIIRRNSPYTDIYERLQLPVVVVDKWDATTITNETLAQWHATHYGQFTDPTTRKRMLHILTLDYWTDYICQHAF